MKKLSLIFGVISIATLLLTAACTKEQKTVGGALIGAGAGAAIGSAAGGTEGAIIGGIGGGVLGGVIGNASGDDR